MSVAKRGDRWRARVEIGVGRQRSKSFRTKSDAKAWEAAQRAALDAGTFVDPVDGRVTFAGYYKDYAARQVWETGTVKAMDLATGSVPFADVPLSRIRRSHVELWIKQMVIDGLMPSTIKTRVVNVRSVLRAAVRDRLIPSDPSDGVTLPRQRKREATLRLPTDEQVSVLLAAAEPEFRTYLALCAFAGLRLGEAAGVQKDDIDFLRRVLHVKRQVQRASGGKLEIRPPKYASERTIPLPDELLHMLSEHIATYGTHGDDEWLFQGKGDEPPHQNTVGARYRVTCKRAGVTGVRLHDLRHYFCSALINAGCDVVQVQRAAGHARATTTLLTYAHLFPSAEDKTRKALAEVMATLAMCDIPAKDFRAHVTHPD